MPAKPVVQSKVEKMLFHLDGLIWVTGLSSAFGYKQVFIGIFTIGMNKLHLFLLKFSKSKTT